MEKKYNSMEFNNLIKCEVCGALNYSDDYGNSATCPHCGWKSNGDSEFFEDCYGISYPMLVPITRAKEQYKKGQKFKATFEDFINGLKFYSEMLFWYKGNANEVFRHGEKAILSSKDFNKEYETIDDFYENAEIDGKRLKDIWDEVNHPCFMYCGEEADYEFPPED